MSVQVTPSGLYQDSVEAPGDGEGYLGVRTASYFQGCPIARTGNFRATPVYVITCKNMAFQINFLARLSGCHFPHKAAPHEHSFASPYPGIISARIMC